MRIPAKKRIIEVGIATAREILTFCGSPLGGGVFEIVGYDDSVAFGSPVGLVVGDKIVLRTEGSVATLEIKGKSEF
jgi:hypothetical protein